MIAIVVYCSATDCLVVGVDVFDTLRKKLQLRSNDVLHAETFHASSSLSRIMKKIHYPLMMNPATELSLTDNFL